MTSERISDDEIVYRRIPPTLPYFEPPDRITTANFKLHSKRGELGLSVYRAAIVTSAQVLALPAAIPGSQIASASVGEIRNLTNSEGRHLNLEVVPADDENNPGHCEIRGPEPGKLSPSASNALRLLFKRT